MYKEIQKGAVASHIYEEMRKYLDIYEEAIYYDFATTPFWIFFYMKKILFSSFTTVPFYRIKSQEIMKI